MMLITKSANRPPTITMANGRCESDLINDQTLEGLRHKRLPVFGVQYHPESSAGPHDSAYLFDEFLGLIRDNT